MPFSTTPDRLEDEFRDAYTAWKKKPGPRSNAALLRALRPAIEASVRAHVGQANPVLFSRARALVLDGLPRYDPRRAGLKTFVHSQLLGLRRFNRQQSTFFRVPERLLFERQQLDEATEELRARFGREPTDQQLADFTGFSLKRIARVRAYQPGVAEGQIDRLVAAGQADTPAVRLPHHADRSALWREVVYDELDDYHKKVMELTLGMHGRRPLDNKTIAARLGRSPGAVSQAKARIQKLLDQEYELSPFSR